MIKKTDIQTEYNEFYEYYANQNIDDYETFIRSRVIEFFINNSQVASDNIIDLVEFVITDNRAVSFEKESLVIDNIDDRSEYSPIEADESVEDSPSKRNCKKNMFFLLPVAYIASHLTHLFNRKSKEVNNHEGVKL